MSRGDYVHLGDAPLPEMMFASLNISPRQTLLCTEMSATISSRLEMVALISVQKKV